MKQLIISSLLILLLSSFVNRSNNNTETDTAFSIDEELTFLLYYGFIDGGEAKISLTPIDSQTICATAKAKTIGLASAIVDIDDIYSSYFNARSCKPQKAIRDIHEGDYTFYNEVEFDHENNKVYSMKSGEIDVPENIYDIISAFYYARTNSFDNINPNDTIVIQTYFADEIFPFIIIYNGEETIKTKSGKFRAMKFTPIVETGRIFEESDDMRFWISTDPAHIPLRVEFDLILGSIKCDLIKYSGVKNKLSFVE